MRMNRTPRRVSAANRERSAGVSAKSSTAEALAEPRRRRELETAKGVIHVARIDFRVALRNLVRASPQSFRVERRRALLVGQVVQRRSSHKAIIRLTTVRMD